MEKEPTNHSIPEHSSVHFRSVKVVTGILAIVLLFLSFLLWRQYAIIRNSHLLLNSPLQFTNLHSRAPLAPQDASYIQTWMTFDYINTAFHLPVDYLETNLDIRNIQYPHISIARYARENNINPSTFVSEVGNAVREYVSNVSAATAESAAVSTATTTP